MGENGKLGLSKLVFRPFSVLYFLIILFWTILLLPFFLVMSQVFTRFLGFSPFFALAIFIFSLLGSHINIPVMEVVSTQPVLAVRKVTFFGVSWFIPEFDIRKQKTIVAINVGGAIVPLFVSVYLLFFTLPSQEVNIFVAYAKVFLALIIVTVVVHAVARPIRGLGIATPAFLPPFITALTSLALYSLYVPTNPFVIAYVSGTLGTLIGADILNLDKVSKLGSPFVSIGGAGTFDGIYLTGLMSVFLVLILI